MLNGSSLKELGLRMGLETAAIFLVVGTSGGEASFNDAYRQGVGQLEGWHQHHNKLSVRTEDCRASTNPANACYFSAGRS